MTDFALPPRFWEENVTKLLVLRFEATERGEHSKASLIDDIIREKKEEAARKEKMEEAAQKERQEIRELEKLRIASTVGFPNFSGAMELFKKTITKSGITAPDTRVLDTLVRRFPMQMAAVSGNDVGALDLYMEIKAMPSTTTTALVESDFQVNLNGPANPENINIIIGSRSDKTPVMVKFLIASTNHPSLSYATLSSAYQNEAEVCERLHLSSTTLPFVRSEVVNVRDSNGYSRKAIIMPTYVRTVADSARLWPASLVDGLARMIAALEHMHSLDLVHMDVKGSNIFIDQAGDWYLGDFGSTCVKGETVTTTTPSFYPTNLGSTRAYPKYDWFMLLVTILIEMMPKKHEWAKELCDTEPMIVTLPRVAKALTKAIDSADVSEQLKRMLSIVAARTELLPSPPSSSP